MKFTAGLALISLAAFFVIAGCVTPIVSETGIGVEVSPVASLTRLKQSEDMFHEAMDKITESVVMLSEGQAELAKELQNEAVALQAKQAELIARAAEQERNLSDAILRAQDEMAIDWTTIALAALGVGGVGAGVPTLASRSRRGAGALGFGAVPVKPTRKRKAQAG